MLAYASIHTCIISVPVCPLRVRRTHNSPIDVEFCKWISISVRVCVCVRIWKLMRLTDCMSVCDCVNHYCAVWTNERKNTIPVYTPNFVSPTHTNNTVHTAIPRTASPSTTSSPKNRTTSARNPKTLACIYARSCRHTGTDRCFAMVRQTETKNTHIHITKVVDELESETKHTLFHLFQFHLNSSGSGISITIRRAFRTVSYAKKNSANSKSHVHVGVGKCVGPITHEYVRTGTYFPAHLCSAWPFH